MTTSITMLSPVTAAGGTLMTVAGSPYSVDDAVAAELVNRGVAVYANAVPPVSEYGVFVTYLTAAQYAQLSTGVIGTIYEITDQTGRPQYRWNGTAFVPAGGGGGAFHGIVADQATMLALTLVNVGDWCERADLSNQAFFLTAAGASTLGNWTSVPLGPTGATGAAGTNGTNGATGPTGPGYAATSTTSLVTAGTGSKSFTTQAGLAYTAGARMRATSTGTGEYMEGIVTSYSGTTLVATMDNASGTGTHTDWNINVAGSPANLLATATLGAGSTNITRATHLNRPCEVNQAGATTGVFAATATSGAFPGDGFELLNIGPGTWTASGAITAPAGYALSCGPGQLFTALYDSVNDAFYSTTVEADRQAPAVASASTVVLNGIGGNFAHITGAATITAITLAQGAQRRVVFDGILTLATGASLILPTGASITTAAGDAAAFVGEAAGVVRCLAYLRADGTALASGAAGANSNSLASAPAGYFGPRGFGDNQFTGSLGTSNPTSIDSCAFGTPATTDGSVGFWQRLRMNSAAAAINRGAGIGVGANVKAFRLDSSGDANGGFPLRINWSLSHTCSTGCRVAVGMTNNASATDYTADPSARITTDCFFVGADAGDANLSVMWNDNVGTPTKTTLGSGYPKTADVPYTCVFDRTGAGVPFVSIINRLSGASTKVTMNDANAPRTTISYGFQIMVGTGTDTVTSGPDIGTCTFGGPSI